METLLLDGRYRRRTSMLQFNEARKTSCYTDTIEEQREIETCLRQGIGQNRSEKRKSN